jgi:hypothetical protein
VLGDDVAHSFLDRQERCVIAARSRPLDASVTIDIIRVNTPPSLACRHLQSIAAARSPENT